jgi:thymidylate synthase (FAD)
MRFDVLDHGYVRFVEDWGRGDADIAEAGIIEAARQSTQGSFRGWEEDQKLLRTLYTSVPPHSGPFEFAGMTIEVQAPIMVFREWHRHRTQSYAEMSARYAPVRLPDYLPTVDRLVKGAREAGKNKQAQAIATATELTIEGAEHWLAQLEELYEHADRIYNLGLASGVPKELARLPMTVGRYSRMRASGNLRNWLAFMTLRLDPAAQFEIRMFAGAVANIIAERFPQTWRLYCS